MPDKITATGIEVQTFNEIFDGLVTGLKGIYGPDINVEQNSQDGQSIGLSAQAGTDIREIAVEVFNSFDPDEAVGTVLDQRIAINNLKRQGGTFTIQPIDITTTATVQLQGLDADFDSLTGTGFTVQDNAGNQFILIDSATLTTGTQTLNFRAAQIGAVQTIPDTITNQVTVVLGVAVINNSEAALTVGQNQETDPQVRVRRQQSTANGSSNYLNGLQGTLLAIPGVTQARVYENFTKITDADGIPGNCIWVIVENGANTDIANAIYVKKTPGTNMKGTVIVNITTPSGSTFPAAFDRPIGQRLYVRFNLKKILPSAVFNTAGIAAYIAANVNFYIGQPADTGTLTVLASQGVASLGGGGPVLDLEISTDGVTYADYITTPTLAGQFTLGAGDIAITVE